MELTTIEREGQLADGTTYTYWTFDGTVPGPLVRVREGDTVELTLRNEDGSSNPHSIDLHAVNGPGGGAPVDREFYVMQGEIYTAQAHGTAGLLSYDADALMAEDPDYVVFNGAVGALTEEGALQAEVGDTVRIYVGNGGPNLVSSFHVIGEIFDRALVEGGSLINQNVQTTLVPAGGATYVEFEADVPGDYLLVDHSLTRALDRGAAGVLSVTGPEDPEVFHAPDGSGSGH